MFRDGFKVGVGSGLSCDVRGTVVRVKGNVLTKIGELGREWVCTHLCPRVGTRVLVGKFCTCAPKWGRSE